MDKQDIGQAKSQVEDGQAKLLETQNSASTKEKSFYQRNAGRIALASAILWQFFLSSQAKVSNITPYMQSYFIDASTSDVQTIFSVFLFSIVIGNVFNAFLTRRKLHPKIIMSLSACLIIGSGFIGSFFTRWVPFQIFYAPLYGFGIGTGLMTPVFICWLYYPESKAMVSGVQSAFYGIGAGMWIFESSYLINPTSEDAIDIRGFEDDPTKKAFPMSVAENFPVAMRLSSISYLIIVTIVIIAMPAAPKTEEEEADEEQVASSQNQTASDSQGKEQEGNEITPAFNKDSEFKDAEQQKEYMNYLTNQRAINVSHTFDAPSSGGLGGPSMDFSVDNGPALQTRKTDIMDEQMNRRNRITLVNRMDRRYTKFYDKQEEEQIVDNDHELKLMDIIRTKQFWHLYIMFTLSLTFGIFYQGSIRSYGGSLIQDDLYMTLVGTVSNFLKLFVFVWSIVMEKFNFKTAYFIVLTIQIINAVVTPIIMELGECYHEDGHILDQQYLDNKFVDIKRGWYFYSLSIALIAQQSHYIFYPVILAKIYGTHGGLLAYTVAFTYQAVASLGNTLMLSLFYGSLGFKGISWIYAGFLITSMVILLFVYKGSNTDNGDRLKDYKGDGSGQFDDLEIDKEDSDSKLPSFGAKAKDIDTTSDKTGIN